MSICYIFLMKLTYYASCLNERLAYQSKREAGCSVNNNLRLTCHKNSHVVQSPKDNTAFAESSNSSKGLGLGGIVSTCKPYGMVSVVTC